MATIASQLHNPPFISSAVPCPSIIVQLLLCFLLLSLQKPCTSFTVNGAFDQLPGYLYLTNMSTCRAIWQRVDGGLASYLRNNHPALNLSQKGWFFAQDPVILTDQFVDASFSVGFTMSAYRPNNETKETSSNLFFAVQPVPLWATLSFTPPNWQILGPSGSSGPTSSTGGGACSHISVDIGTAQDNGTLMLHLGGIIWVQIGIEPPDDDSSVARKYSVWIDYDHVSHRISVYVDDASEGMPKRGKAIDSKIISVEAQVAMLGLFASIGQLLQVHTWNLTVDELVSGVGSGGSPEKKIILCSVLGSAAATAITTALVLLYVNSKYRRWKKEQDELTKIMQGIPGVPTHVDFTDIKKATKNFHDTMKLGKGGFGAVYRCTLPARASRTGQAMDVAVKKFMREVEDRRYSDFLTEVSIINRLRHKNIVPLIGWSYNKGEPLLVYEYMTNGSLDQHIFLNGSGAGQQQVKEEDTSLWQWHTRYAIARDIATGLHYVHHEHEPMVLHRDIKASNIMLDSDFRARLGDFGIACAVAVNRSSVTGIAGTWGYIAPDYAMSYRATRLTDIYAFGVLILEVVTGKKNGDVPPDDDHITDWIWRLHGEGKLLDAVDASLLATGDDDKQDNGVAYDEAKRLLLLGLACTNPNPSDRPSMADVLQMITKVRPPPDVPPQKPSFMWPPRDWRTRNSVYSTAGMDWDGSSASTAELVPVSLELPLSQVSQGQGSSIRSRAATGGSPAMVQSCLQETQQTMKR